MGGVEASDPATWPLAPPSEPGYYWLALAGYPPFIVHIPSSHRGEIWPFTYSGGFPMSFQFVSDYGGRWHPQRIEQP